MACHRLAADARPSRVRARLRGGGAQPRPAGADGAQPLGRAAPRPTARPRRSGSRSGRASPRGTRTRRRPPRSQQLLGVLGTGHLRLPPGRFPGTVGPGPDGAASAALRLRAGEVARRRRLAERARAARRRRAPLTTQPATGSAPSSLPRDRAEAEARRRPSRAPRAARLWSISTPCAAASRSTSRIWFSVSTGQVGAGDEDRDAEEAVLPREALDQLVAHGLPEHRQPRRERRAAVAEARRERARDLLDREAGAGRAHDDVGGEHVGHVEDARVPVWTATTGTPARFAARSSRSSSSVGAPASTRTSTPASSIRPADRTAPGAAPPRASSFASCSASDAADDERPRRPAAPSAAP